MRPVLTVYGSTIKLDVLYEKSHQLQKTGLMAYYIQISYPIQSHYLNDNQIPKSVLNPTLYFKVNKLTLSTLAVCGNISIG
jgi:hypothetical protein